MLRVSSVLGGFDDFNKSVRVGYNRYTGMPVYKNKEEILKSIEEVEHEYCDDDCYFLFEENSFKFNCFIYNDGTEFLEDVKIELFFDSSIFIISKEIFENPKANNGLFGKIKDLNYNYPSVYEDDGYIVVETFHNQIRHKTLTEVFL